MHKLTIKEVQYFIQNNEIPFASTHPKLCVPIINRIYQKMCFNIKFDAIKLCDNLIIDGHHRYLSSLISGFKIDIIPSYKTAATRTYQWKDVVFEENDWDTASKIEYLNEKDAAYNNLEIKVISKIISIKNSL